MSHSAPPPRHLYEPPAIGLGPLEEDDVVRWLIERKLTGFERTFDYDMTYARDILDAAGVRGLMRFMRAGGIGEFRQGVPEVAWHAARVAAIRIEDCGPCTQLMVTMALKANVPESVLAAVLSNDDDALPTDAQLAVRFVRSTMARDADVDGFREEVVERFGQAGLVTLAYAVTAARVYPTVKYALGYGRACERVKVGSSVVTTVASAA